ncbi:MAG: glutamate--cysteine ligase, partial [Miltoncostaeaceae bacterium]
DGAARIDAAARGFGARAAMVGTLPTLTLADLGPGGLTASARYRALEAGLDALKSDHTIAIDGRERLEVELPGIVAEAANAAFQVHLRVAPGDFARTLNAAQIATGPALAVSGNSPTFLGQVLWEETRVPVFHQSIDGVDGVRDSWRPDRVSFGHGWVRAGALELFEESVALHPALLPLSSAEEPLAALAGGGVPELHELRLHHGTTWRWNRAVFDPAGGGHVRIEFRALPSGPSVADMAANAAFMVGLTLALADEEWMLNAVPFRCVRRNFFEAARHGMDAELLWPEAAPPSPRPQSAPALLEHLVDMAREALVAAAVNHDEADAHLEPIRRRIAAGITGSSWQREAIGAAERRGAMRGRALATTLDAYLDASASGDAVHSWPSASEATAP